MGPVALSLQNGQNSKSDILCEPSIASASLSPVLIEIQRNINHSFIDRLLNKSLNVKKKILKSSKEFLYLVLKKLVTMLHQTSK